MPIATTTALILGGAALAGGALSANAASNAADAQEKAAKNAAALQQKQYEQTRADLGIYRDTGSAATKRYGDLIGLNGADAQAAARAAFQTDPGYEFAMSEGNRAVEGSAAARGGVLNGGTLIALARRAQGQADQQYGSYLDRFLNLSSLGENAAAQTGNFGAQSASQQGQYLTDAGAAKAGGYLGQAQAYTGAINNALKLGGYTAGRY